MKKITFTLLVFITFHSFGQLTFSTSTGVINYLNGGWSFYRQCGGMIGGCQYPTTLGTKDIIFKIIPGSTDSIAYEIFQNGVSYTAGHSMILPASPMYGPLWTIEKVKLMPSFLIDMTLYTTKTDSVFLAENCSDCYTETFYRNAAVALPEIGSAINELVLFPNPANDNFTLRGLASEQIENIRITDLTGKIVADPEFRNGSVDVSKLPAGLYFVLIRSGQTVCIRKLIRL